MPDARRRPSLRSSLTNGLMLAAQASSELRCPRRPQLRVGADGVMPSTSAGAIGSARLGYDADDDRDRVGGPRASRTGSRAATPACSDACAAATRAAIVVVVALEIDEAHVARRSRCAASRSRYACFNAEHASTASPPRATIARHFVGEPVEPRPAIGVGRAASPPPSWRRSPAGWKSSPSKNGQPSDRRPAPRRRSSCREPDTPIITTIIASSPVLAPACPPKPLRIIASSRSA